MTKDQEIEALKKEVSRLTELLLFIGTSDCGGEIHPIGPAEYVYGEDGNTIINVVGPWVFLSGQGDTFIEAVEDHKNKTGKSI